MGQKLTVAVSLVFSLTAFAQQTPPKPSVSEAELTSEQIAVYRTVLAIYLNGSDGTLNLANITEPLEAADRECLKGFDDTALKGAAPFIHKIGPSLVADTKIVLVDPGRQQERVQANDPQNLMRKAIDDHQNITDAQLNRSIKTAFDNGLFTLSEIVFDKEHRHAVVSYSFVCGGLCGNGNTLILKKVGEGWKLAKRCGGWVS